MKRLAAKRFGEIKGDWQPSAAVPERGGALCRKREDRPFRALLTVDLRTGTRRVDRMHEIYPWWRSKQGGTA